MNTEELDKLRETNYYEYFMLFMSHDNFKKIKRNNYKRYFKENGFDVLIKKENEIEVNLNFKHDSVDFCFSDMDFNNSGILLNVRAQILPFGFLNKKRTNNIFIEILNLFKQIAYESSTTIEEKVNNKQYQLIFKGLVINLVRGENSSKQPFVSVWIQSAQEI